MVERSPVETSSGRSVVGGVARTHVVVAPTDAPVTSLLLVLHGSDSDAAQFRELSGHTFDRLTAHGVLVVCPEAHAGTWNDARLGTRAVARLNGTADPIVPFEGGTASLWGQQSRGRVLSSEESARLFASRNGISAAPVTEQVCDGALPTTRTRWRQEGRAPVDFYAVHGGGHTVPNRDHDAPAVLGPTLRDLDAGDLIGDFFGLAPAS